MNTRTQHPRKPGDFSASLALLVAALALAGCGGGDSGGGSSGGGNQNSGGDPAPASIAGKTFHGHINGTSVNWQIVFGGSGSSGSYTHSEPPYQPETGTYTYSKTSSNTGVVNLSFGPGTVLQLTYASAGSGTYLIPSSAETGTFTSN